MRSLTGRTTSLASVVSTAHDSSAGPPSGDCQRSHSPAKAKSPPWHSRKRPTFYPVQAAESDRKQGRKSLPLSRPEAASWHDFVIAAYRMNAIVDPESFSNWLGADGWPRESAAELNLRFFDQCQLLSRYADEVSAA
jgi:hypothetical protein